MIRHLSAMWAYPDHHGCMGAKFGAVVDVDTGVTFGVATGVETITAGFGLWSQMQLGVVLVEQLW